MSKIYIVCNSYNPNTAPTNRILSFIRGFSELNVEAEVVFLVPDSSRSKVKENYPHISFRYMWERMRVSNRILNKISEEYYE